MHVRTGDLVQVMSGDDRGKRGKVLRAIPSRNKVVVEGVNRVNKHIKPSRRSPQGGRLSKEMPIDASNVQLICPQTNLPTRVGIRLLINGIKERYSKRSGAAMGLVAPSKSSRRTPINQTNKE